MKSNRYFRFFFGFRILFFGATTFISLAQISGCAILPDARHITGEPLIYGIDHTTGKLVDRDLATGGSAFHKDEIITLVVNNVFIKFLEQFSRSHVLVYAEVYDDATDNPSKAYRKVLFNAENTPPGVNLGVADRILYGPTPYKGHPIRIRFYIVQLIKDQKQIATKLINAAGGVAQTLIPSGAATVDIAVQLAQGLNELTEDDFELRFDLTLYPTTGAVKWESGDEKLEKAKEPNQRHNKAVHLVMPLRTGPYVIAKREFHSRASERINLEDPCAQEAGINFDHAQEAFFRNYWLFEKAGPNDFITTEEVLRYNGGYLYWVVRNVDARGFGGPQVRTCENYDRKSAVGVGIRSFYRARTYAVFTVLNGISTGLNEEQLRSASDRDMKDIRSLLDNPDQVPLADRIGPLINQTASTITTAIETRRITLRAARLVNVDPAFRKDGRYPEFWLQNLALVDRAKPDEARETRARNIAVLGVLAEVVLNLPLIKPDDNAAIQCVKQFRKDSFDSVENNPGLFYLKADALTKLKEKKCGNPQTVTSSNGSKRSEGSKSE